ncbi:MAG: adenylosuccinate synthetase [Candidatus Ranarchaeia archaeon]
MTVNVLLGGAYGDEGKGKIVSYLAHKDNPKIVARGGVGPNAGHTVVYKGEVYKLRQLPCGFTSDESRLLIGAGCLVNPAIFLKEIEITKTKNRIGIDKRTGIIRQRHIDEDKGSDYLSKKVGSTGTGCGPANRDRVNRKGEIAGSVLELQDYITDVSDEINNAIEEGKDILLEGSQGALISMYYGDVPYTTSKDTTAGSLCADVGIGPTKVDEVIVVLKAYMTRVGAGPLVGEISPEEAKKRNWYERGTVTGRERRSAPFDIGTAKRGIRLNGATQIALTKLDILYPKTASMNNYEEIPNEAKDFIKNIEKELKLSITLIGTGPGAMDIIDRRT